MKASRSCAGMVIGDHFGGGQFAGWYFYPASVCPYPDPYVPPTANALSAGYWHYRAGANAYYPYVTECPSGWQPVVPQAPAS